MVPLHFIWLHTARGFRGDVEETHIGGYEGPLWQLLLLQILFKAGKVLDLRCTVGVVGNVVKENQGVVLAHVRVGKGLLVGKVETLEAGVWHVLLISTPRDLFGVE